MAHEKNEYDDDDFDTPDEDAIPDVDVDAMWADKWDRVRAIDEAAAAESKKNLLP